MDVTRFEGEGGYLQTSFSIFTLKLFRIPKVLTFLFSALGGRIEKKKRENFCIYISRHVVIVVVVVAFVIVITTVA
jgi:hypothetical protein